MEAYWSIGKRIVEVEQQGAIKAAYGAGLLASLATELSQRLGSGLSERNLQRMRAFYLRHPKSPPAAELTWTQHAELLPIENSSQRQKLIQRAVREGLDSKALRQLVHAELVREQVALNLERVPSPESRISRPESRGASPDLLIPVRGTLYTYRIFQPTSLDKSSKTRQVVVGAKATTKLVGETDSELLIDLGFCSYLNLTDISHKKFSPSDIVISSKTNEGFTLSVARCPLSDLYTYKASVEKVVDGDTLRVVVDLGFGFKTRQYLRLRGLDCPETDTVEGKKATDFVKARIKQADEVILTSSKSDKYDRYLADVFFTDKEGQEIYLNNFLLEQGYAIRVYE